MAQACAPLLQPLPEVSAWELAPGYLQGRETRCESLGQQHVHTPHIWRGEAAPETANGYD